MSESVPVGNILPAEFELNSLCVPGYPPRSKCSPALTPILVSSVMPGLCSLKLEGSLDIDSPGTVIIYGCDGDEEAVSGINLSRRSAPYDWITSALNSQLEAPVYHRNY